MAEESSSLTAGREALLRLRLRPSAGVTYASHTVTVSDKTN